MEDMSTSAIVFMAMGWVFVWGLLITTMKKVLTDETEYDEMD